MATQEYQNLEGKWLELYHKETGELIKRGRIIESDLEYSHHHPIKGFQISINDIQEFVCYQMLEQYRVEIKI
jgi:hypothetical protein